MRGLSAYFVWLNRSKESLTLDLKHARAREIMAKLIAKADVFVQNLLPGATDRMGLSAEKLHSLHPRLVVCDISGYGDTGPYRKKKAYDFLIQAEAGLLSVTGSPEEPRQVRASPSPTSAAGMYAYSGILSALYLRERTGLGNTGGGFHAGSPRGVDGATVVLLPLPGEPAAAGRGAARHARPVWSVPDGRGGSLVFGLQSEREWKVFRDDVLGLPGLDGDPRFDSNPQRVANWDGARRGHHLGVLRP